MKANKGIIIIELILTILLLSAQNTSAADCSNAIGGSGSCNCGDTIVGNYTFNSNMICNDNTTFGLIIGANNIIIDGAGYCMTGNRGTCTLGITGDGIFETIPAKHSAIFNNGNFDNVLIRNLEIKNFCTGIALGSTNSRDIDNNTVTLCMIHDCGESEVSTHGIHAVGINNCSITENEIYGIDGSGADIGCDGGGNGIFMYGVEEERGNYNTIKNNNLSYNRKSGFFMKMQCMHNIFYGNTATNNEEGGIAFMCERSNYNYLQNNNASGNSMYGIYIGGWNNTIINNSANNNQFYGINMGRSGGSFNNTLYENTVCGNGDLDIRTCGLEYGNHGVDNTCDTTYGYNDDGTTGCTLICGSGNECGDVTCNGVVDTGDVILLSNYVGYSGYVLNCRLQ